MTIFLFTSFFLYLTLLSPFVSAKSYMSQQEFFNSVQQSLSPAEKFQTKTLWLKKEIQSEVSNILDHKYPKLRVRYKISDGSKPPTSVWYLDEIGKERPITFGVSIKNSRVQMIQVLEFRESRGYEISIPAFAKQFEDIGVDDEHNLDQNIDGITGATMSVSAMKKIARLAILLHKTVLSSSTTSENK